MKSFFCPLDEALPDYRTQKNIELETTKAPSIDIVTLFKRTTIAETMVFKGAFFTLLDGFIDDLLTS